MGLKSFLFRGRRQSSETLLITPPRGTPNRKGRDPDNSNTALTRTLRTESSQDRSDIENDDRDPFLDDDDDDDDGQHHATSLKGLPQQLKIQRRSQYDDDVSSIHVGESVNSPQRKDGSGKSKSELNHHLITTPPRCNGAKTGEKDDATRKVLFPSNAASNTITSDSTAPLLATTTNATLPQDPFSSWLDTSKTAVERLLSFGSDHTQTVMDQWFSLNPNQKDDDTATVFIPAGGEVCSVASQPSSFASTAGGTNYTERAGNVTKKKDVLSTLICLSLLECSNSSSNSGGGTGESNNHTTKQQETTTLLLRNSIYSSIPERMVRESLRRHLELTLAGDVVDGPLQPPPTPTRQTGVATSTQRQNTTTTTTPATTMAGSLLARRKSLPVSVDDDLLEVNDQTKIANYAEQCLARREYSEAIEIYRTLWKKQRDSNEAGTTPVAMTLTKLALLNLLVGRLELAMKYSKAALKIYRKEARPGQVAMSLMQVGMIYFAANRLGPALKSWREALHLVYKAMGYDNINIPILLNNIGCLHMEAGDVTSSLRTLEESLDLQRTALSASTSDTNVSLIQMATTMCNIAMVSARRLEIEVAIGLLEEARALQESVLPSEHHALIQLTTDTLERIMEMREGALANAPAATFAMHLFGKRALDNEQDDDDQNFDTATFSTEAYPLQRMDSGTNNRSASVFGDGDGIPMRRGSCKSLTTTMSATDNIDFLLLGPLENELTLEQRVRESILAGFGKTPEEDEAPRLPFVAYESASRRRLRIPVDIDGVVLDAELHLQGISAQAMEHLDHDEIDEALELFESALQSHREKYGQVHHLVGSALHNMGIVHLFAGRNNIAQTHFQQAANVRTSALGADHPDVAASLLKISMILMAARDLHGAHAILLQILQGLRSSLGSGHPQVAKVLNNLGVLEYEMGAIHNAFTSLEEAHDIQCRLGLGLRSRFPQRHEFAELAVSNTLCNLGFLYAKSFKYSDAARMYQEAFRLQSKYLHAKHPLLIRTGENVAFVQAQVTEQRSQSAMWQTLSPLIVTCGSSLRSMGYATS